MFSERFVLHRVEIADLPLYNQDFDHDYPAAGLRFKQEVEAADALLFVTPEYNRSMPGVLKNAIDVGSAPAGQQFLRRQARRGHRHFAGRARYGAGAAASAQCVRRRWTCWPLPQPEVDMQFHEGLIDEQGGIGDERTLKFLQIRRPLFDLADQDPFVGAT